MNRWRSRGRGMSMTSILVLMVVCIVAVALTGCMILFISRYQRAMEQSAKTSSEQAVEQVASVVGSYTRDMNQAMAMLVEALEEEEDPDAFFDNFLKIRPDVVAVTRYDSQGELLDCWALDRQPREHILENLSFDKRLLESGQESSISAPHVESIFEGYYPWVVTMTQKIDGEDGESWLALDLSFSNISSYINNVGIGQHGYCFLTDTGGSIVYHPQQQLLYSGIKNESAEEQLASRDGNYTQEDMICSVKDIEGSSWRVVGVSYVDELVTANVAVMIQIALTIVAAVLLVTAVSSLILSGVLSRPLHSLSNEMEKFEQNAAEYTYHPVKGAREVGALSDAFGHMVVKIQDLMAKVREEEINLRKTELKALQAQINPHFLYNTLDSIAWMCEQERSADAVQMVHALATLFRISISKGHELIPITKEIEHAKSYLQIQKYRYKNQFSYTFNVDPACEEFYCNKLTLQPIIENAIYHGLDLMVEEGRIDVTVRQDGEDIVFTVEDNGVGMSQEQVAHMLHREPGDRTGIGIKNVNDRLRIYFGEGYGLKITSELDEGTCVEIRMPKVKRGEYGEK